MTSRHLILILDCRLGFQSLIFCQKQLFADLLQNSVLKTFAIFTWKHLCWSLFLTMMQAYYKETYTQVCSCEYCKIFKNSFFIEHLLWLLVHFIQMVSFFSLEKKQKTTGFLMIQEGGKGPVAWNGLHTLTAGDF